MIGLSRIRQQTRAVDAFRRALKAGLEPGRAAAAVWVGITLGLVPIYGFQALAALLVARLLGLNPVLTLGATFINNPLLQPLLVVSALQLGHLLLRGEWMSFSWSALRASGVMPHVAALFVGSFVLSAIIGGPAAACTYVVFARRKRGMAPVACERDWRACVNRRFRGTHWYARGFVRWKMRLDRLFAFLAETDLGTGPAVDLGCGYGACLALVSTRDPGRELRGCDLDARRIQAARVALAGLNAQVSVADIRAFPLHASGLILILDVLQYLSPADQMTVLQRSVDALLPGGRLIFRLPESGSLLGALTGQLDRVCLRVGGSRRRPAYMPLDAYTRLLADAGLTVDVRTYRNRLPLAHVVVSASKPGALR